MAVYSFSTLHLGNIAELDTTDGNTIAENQSALLGTYRSANDPAANHITTLMSNDGNSDGLINSNDQAAPDSISFDLGDGPVNTYYDAIFNADVTVTFSSGSGEPPYNGLGGIIQTETGDLFFVMIDSDLGMGTNAFAEVPIDSITVNSISLFGNQQMAWASDGEEFVPCFSAGTQIKTRQGLVSVEKISIGDQVDTLDNGYQTICWVGRRYLSANQLGQHPNLRAICIDAGALGDGFPERDLVVSPQHRVMLRSKITQRMADLPEILVPAIKLVGFPGVRQLQCRLGIQYHHIACSSHQLIWANGAIAETLFLGPQAKKGLSPIACEELKMVMPDAFKDPLAAPNLPVRPIVQRRAFLQNLLDRHVKNDTPLVSM